MKSIKKIVENWLNLAFPNRSLPQIGKVEKTGTGAGEGNYSAQVRLLRPGSLDETEEIIERVPLSPIWVNSSGAGVFAPPPLGALVIVGFVDGCRAYPYIQQVYGYRYNSGEFAAEFLTLTSGDVSLVVKKDLIEMGGSDASAVLYEKLQQALSVYDSKIAAELGKIAAGIASAGGAYSPGSVSHDISSAQAAKVKLQ